MIEIVEKYNKLKKNKKLEFIREIEFEDIPKKWDLIDKIINDKKEYDLARIEALKILEIAEVPKEWSVKFADAIIALITNEKDYDVRNYAVIASRNFINSREKLLNAVTDLVRNNKEDIDVRHNAYSAILKIDDKQKRTSVLKMLLEDPEFGKYAKNDI